MNFFYEKCPSLEKRLIAKNIFNPIGVQKEVFDYIFNGLDTKFQSPTGSGKTFAYLLPLIERCITQNTATIIIAPSSELCSQINQEIQSLCSIKTALLIDGANIKNQLLKLKNININFFIATPLRLQLLINKKKFSKKKIDTIIFDEADLLLQEFDIKTLLKAFPYTIQKIYCSATCNQNYSDEVLLYSPKVQSIEQRKLNENIIHSSILCSSSKEINLLKLIKQNLKQKPALLFTNSLNSATFLFHFLQKNKINCAILNSSKHKIQRKKNITLLQQNKLQILITTDLLARGINLSSITVIQYDIARNKEYYIHRAGRCARGTSKGDCISLITKKDKFIFEKYIKSLSIDYQKIILK